MNVRTLLSCGLLLGAACGPDDVLHPERSGDAFATLMTPGVQVTGALLELTGVAEVILTDGDVVTRRSGNVLRAIILLDKPGTLDFGVRLVGGMTQPTGTILTVIDSSDRVIASLGNFSLVFDK